MYLISLTFRQEEDVSPDDSDNWLHLNVRLQGLMIFYVFTCFNMHITEKKRGKKNILQKIADCERAEKLIRDLLFFSF